MLKQRIIWGGVLFIGVLFILLALPQPYFIVPLLIVLILVGWEWSQFMTSWHWIQKVLYLASLIASFILLNFFAGIMTVRWVIVLGAVGWFAVLVGLLFCRNERQLRLIATYRLPFQCVSGFLTLLPAWLAFYDLYHQNHGYLLGLIVLISVSDIGAYFAGKAWGRHPLSFISPNKTLEGLAGGVASALLIWALGLATMSFLRWPNTVAWLSGLDVIKLTGWVIVLVGFGVAGDLFESLQKRLSGVKDSGWLLPGHGGILDRIDSIIAAAPLLSVVITLHIL